MRVLCKLALLLSLALLTNCASLRQVNFPPPQEVFITTGDGDITKPYQPVGHLIYTKRGFRLGFLPLFGLIPFGDASAQTAVNDIIAKEARAMGGDAVINLDIKWIPPSDGILGLGANGGALFIQGTVIKR